MSGQTQLEKHSATIATNAIRPAAIGGAAGGRRGLGVIHIGGVQ
jgi:hypothetical protein